MTYSRTIPPFQTTADILSVFTTDGLSVTQLESYFILFFVFECVARQV